MWIDRASENDAELAIAVFLCKFDVPNQVGVAVAAGFATLVNEVIAVVHRLAVFVYVTA